MQLNRTHDRRICATISPVNRAKHLNVQLRGSHSIDDRRPGIFYSLSEVYIRRDKNCCIYDEGVFEHTMGRKHERWKESDSVVWAQHSVMVLQ